MASLGPWAPSDPAWLRVVWVAALVLGSLGVWALFLLCSLRGRSPPSLRAGRCPPPPQRPDRAAGPSERSPTRTLAPGLGAGAGAAGGGPSRLRFSSDSEARWTGAPRLSVRFLRGGCLADRPPAPQIHPVAQRVGESAAKGPEEPRQQPGAWSGSRGAGVRGLEQQRTRDGAPTLQGALRVQLQSGSLPISTPPFLLPLLPQEPCSGGAKPAPALMPVVVRGLQEGLGGAVLSKRLDETPPPPLRCAQGFLALDQPVCSGHRGQAGAGGGPDSATPLQEVMSAQRKEKSRMAEESSSGSSGSPSPGDTLPWNLPRHQRTKRTKAAAGNGTVLDPAERAVIRIAGREGS
ncbi:hypothetical protein lerEdw1_014454, partial [Lerista edwardsae]